MDLNLSLTEQEWSDLKEYLLGQLDEVNEANNITQGDWAEELALLKKILGAMGVAILE